LKCQTSSPTVTLSFGIKYSMHGLICHTNIMVRGRRCYSMDQFALEEFHF